MGLWTIAFLAILVTAYAIQFGISNIRDSGAVQEDSFIVFSGDRHMWIIVHAFSGSLALLVGWMQFIRRWRRGSLRMHRMIGMLYTLGIAVGGLTGLYLALFATGGLASSLGFGLLSLGWLVTTGIGVYAIVVRKSPIEHSKWMLRSYALAFAAVTLRIYLPAAVISFGEDNFITSYKIIAWLCWVPNLFFAEWLIRRKAYRNNNTPSFRA